MNEHSVLFLCHIFAQRPMIDRKIERSDGRGLGRQQLLADSMEISFHMKKWQGLKLGLNLELWHYCAA